ncbi:MAG: U32 family peptidase, partial [Clostridia bacterium]|nr:U32 family peptidase [Clostridia bacterium]
MKKIPELLSPAGSAAAMVAAVQCGADAIYLGAGDFNARRNADNFGGELDAAVGYCHARGTQVYVTLNTMVRQDELSRLEKTIGEICTSGADGVIVQDIGVAKAVHQMTPTLPLHASTQLAVHNPQGVEFLVKNGFTRVVMAREMEFEEIARCAGLGAELEVFIHGALCVSCSGQCLMSSIIGGRSGNRGLCAQPCRMKYRMD